LKGKNSPFHLLRAVTVNTQFLAWIAKVVVASGNNLAEVRDNITGNVKFNLKDQTACSFSRLQQGGNKIN
jgi:uncharacterized alkaline shock family protein YloU